MAGNLTAMIAAAFSGSAAPPVTSDPYFDYTTLLLPGNGTNGAQNNTFLDSSTNNFTITRNGNTTQGTFSPFSQTGWGNYFGSSTANFKFASDASFAIGTGNFSIECFVNFAAWSGTNQRVCIQGVSGTTNVQIARDSGANELYIDIQTSRVITYAWTPTIGQWYHLALVRSGTGSNQVALYIDGTSVATGTSSASIAQNQFLVGGVDWASGYSLQGYISNLRYSNVARTITVPTSAYTSDANTLILTCQSNRFVDNSATPKAITAINGTVSVQAFSPFNPSASWSAATYGGSGYFDGSGDYLTAPDNAAFQFGSGDFTIEFWIYPQATPSGWLIGKGDAASVTGSEISWTAAGTYDFYYGGSALQLTSPALTVGSWQHIAAVRNGTTITIYKNGVSSTSGSIGTSSLNTGGSNPFSIGQYAGGAFNGYFSSLRVVKGTAVYTSNFTPPTAPLTAITNTSLLLNFTNAGIYDATSKNDLETVGNAQISTTQSKWGGSSMYFDGTGDYLTNNNASNSLLAFGTGDFTIEGWFYSNNASSAAQRGMFQTSDTIGGLKTTYTTGVSMSHGATTGELNVNVGSTVYSTSGASITTGAWFYFAITRSSGNVNVYVNGVSRASGSGNTNNLTGTYISVGGYYSTSYLFDGYLQDFRITKGYARTITASPTAAFPTL